MTEIKITEENKEMYEEYYLIKSGALSYKKNFIRWIPKTIASILLPMVLMIPIVSTLSKVIHLSTLLMITSSICTIVMMGGLMAHNIKTLKLQDLKQFQSKYPDFDMTLDKEKVEELIEEYKLGIQKKEMLTNLNELSLDLTEEEKIERVNTFMSMTNDEKIAFLEREKDFWCQYKEQENMKEEEKSKQNKMNFKQ